MLRLTLHTAPLLPLARKVCSAADTIACEHPFGEDLPRAVRTGILLCRYSGVRTASRDLASLRRGGLGLQRRQPPRAGSG